MQYPFCKYKKVEYRLILSVAKGPKYRPKNKKGPKNLCGAGKLWGETFGRFMKKRAEKG
jgi:hypothetical protein